MSNKIPRKEPIDLSRRGAQGAAGQNTGNQAQLPVIVPVGVGLAAIAAIYFGVTAITSFDHEQKSELYAAFENAALNDVHYVADTCPLAVQSAALGYLTMADSRQTHTLQDMYDGPFTEAATSFKYYQRVPYGAASPVTVGSLTEMQNVNALMDDFDLANIIVTAQLVPDPHYVAASIYVPEDSHQPTELTYSILDLDDGAEIMERGLTTAEWARIQELLNEGAFNEAGSYHFHRTLDEEQLEYSYHQTSAPVETSTNSFLQEMRTLTRRCTP